MTDLKLSGNEFVKSVFMFVFDETISKTNAVTFTGLSMKGDKLTNS